MFGTVNVLHMLRCTGILFGYPAVLPFVNTLSYSSWGNDGVHSMIGGRKPVPDKITVALGP